MVTAIFPGLRGLFKWAVLGAAIPRTPQISFRSTRGRQRGLPRCGAGVLDRGPHGRRERNGREDGRGLTVECGASAALDPKDEGSAEASPRRSLIADVQALASS